MIHILKLFSIFLLIFSANQLVLAQTPIKVEEGFDYRVLPITQPIDAKGKVEVIEFFWYGCPHCYEFEPELKGWIKRQNKDVVFKKVPIAFREELMPHSQLFYALEALGKGDTLNDKVMFAMHRENKRLLIESSEQVMLNNIKCPSCASVATISEAFTKPCSLENICWGDRRRCVH